MFGFSEAFADSKIDLGRNTDAICFTDDPTLRSRVWQFRHVDSKALGPVRTAKMVKILAHLFVSDYQESLYIDNRVKLIAPARKLFSLLGAADCPMKAFLHPWRDCAYEESKVVTEQRIDDAATVEGQMKMYRDDHYPEHAGLIAGTVLLRRHNDPVLQAVMEEWFREVRRHSYRDQLSFNYVAWRRGFKVETIPGTLLKNRFIAWPNDVGPRVPRDFRDADYLVLNPDVQATGMSPREHYLKLGAQEGRIWRREETR